MGAYTQSTQRAPRSVVGIVGLSHNYHIDSCFGLFDIVRVVGGILCLCNDTLGQSDILSGTTFSNTKVVTLMTVRCMLCLDALHYNSSKESGAPFGTFDSALLKCHLLMQAF